MLGLMITSKPELTKLAMPPKCVDGGACDGCRVGSVHHRQVSRGCGGGGLGVGGGFGGVGLSWGSFGWDVVPCELIPMVGLGGMVGLSSAGSCVGWGGGALLGGAACQGSAGCHRGSELDERPARERWSAFHGESPYRIAI